jgi:hypothetical protein
MGLLPLLMPEFDGYAVSYMDNKAITALIQRILLRETIVQ